MLINMEAHNILLEALATLTPPQLADLTHTISTLLLRRRRRLFSLLSSPALFSLALHHLHSLSLPHKSLLIANYLLSNLTILTQSINKSTTATLPPCSAASMRQRDLDAVLLLLLFCELRQHDDKALDNVPPSHWRGILCDYVSDVMLKISKRPLVGSSNTEVLLEYLEEVAKCRNFVSTMCCGGGGGNKERKEVAASVAAVVALPSVEVRDGGKECVVCKEEMAVGRDVCELPCQHSFHWLCILPWLQKRNTCPCCRFPLPTDDVLSEIQRLWELLTRPSQGCCYLYGDYSSSCT